MARAEAKQAAVRCRHSHGASGVTAQGKVNVRGGTGRLCGGNNNNARYGEGLQVSKYKKHAFAQCPPALVPHTLTADPEDEPPGMRPGAAGLRGVP